MPIDFKPSDVLLLDDPMPFVGTFKDAESECMAGMMVATLATSGDAWGPVRPSAIGVWMRTATEGLWAAVLGFINPHPHRLVASGFCEWVDPAGARDRALAFTDKGLDAMRKWVRVQPQTGID